MDDASFQLLGSFLPTTYVQQAKDARNTRQSQVNQLLEKVFFDFFHHKIFMWDTYQSLNHSKLVQGY